MSVLFNRLNLLTDLNLSISKVQEQSVGENVYQEETLLQLPRLNSMMATTTRKRKTKRTALVAMDQISLMKIGYTSFMLENKVDSLDIFI